MLEVGGTPMFLELLHGHALPLSYQCLRSFSGSRRMWLLPPSHFLVSGLAFRNVSMPIDPSLGYYPSIYLTIFLATKYLFSLIHEYI